MSRVHARYLVETPLPLRDAAAFLAGEQSSGTFVAVPGETEDLKARFAARVEDVRNLGMVDFPSLPGCRAENSIFKYGEVTVSWNVENFGYNLPTLVSTLQGNLYELAQFSGLRLLDFELPDEFADTFSGPHHGVSGTRRLCGAQDRPLIGTIIKPSIGMSPEQTAEIVDTLATAGIEDFGFSYVITRGDTLYTRPTSRAYYGLTVEGDAVTITRNEPSFQKKLQELHFGHGPSLYREFQKVFAAGMVFIILSGLWLGLSSDRLRRNTLISAGAGVVVFVALIMS